MATELSREEQGKKVSEEIVRQEKRMSDADESGDLKEEAQAWERLEILRAEQQRLRG